MLPEEKQKLLDYIKTAIDLETDIETQNQISAEYQTWIAAKKPVLIKKELPRLKYLDEPSSAMNVIVIMVGIFCIASVIGIWPILKTVIGKLFVVVSLLGGGIWMTKVGVDEIKLKRKQKNIIKMKQYEKKQQL